MTHPQPILRLLVRYDGPWWVEVTSPYLWVVHLKTALRTSSTVSMAIPSSPSIARLFRTCHRWSVLILKKPRDVFWKTSWRFLKNLVTFSEKPRDVFWKTSWRFFEKPRDVFSRTMKCRMNENEAYHSRNAGRQSTRTFTCGRASVK